MAFYSGTSGTLEFGSGRVIGKVQNWSLTSTVETLATTTLGDTDDTFIHGNRSHSGSFGLLYYSGTETDDIAYATTIINKLVKQRTSLTDGGKAALPDDFKLKVKLDDGTANGKYVQMDVILTSAALTMSVGAVFSAEFNFQSKGAPEEVVI
mgnify:CR=1 FL=1|jgi:hypothetical protein|tara:strand:- start:20 stop:475 length:456 start_codon:yes stop_codon:yes gene_type:complete